MRYLVAVCAHRTGDGGGEAGPNQLAVLDETCCGDSRPDRRRCLHVHPVQGLFESVHAMEGQKQVGGRQIMPPSANPLFIFILESCSSKMHQRKWHFRHNNNSRSRSINTSSVTVLR